MIHLFSIFALCCLINQPVPNPDGADELYQLDELAVSVICWAAVNGDTVCLSYLATNGNGEIALFNFKTEQATLVRDGRLKTIVPFVMPTEQGFALINAYAGSQQAVGFIDVKGRFVTNKWLSELEGWRSDLELVYIFPVSPKRTLFSLRGKDNRLHLGVVDLNAFRMNVSLSIPINDDFRRIWMEDGNRLMILTPETGKIHSVDRQTGRFLKRLRPGQEPVQSRKDFKAITKRSYQEMLAQPHLIDKDISLMWYKHRDAAGDLVRPLTVSGLLLSQDRLIEQPFLMLGSRSDKALVFDFQDRTFHIRRSHQE